jgi:hypothetical protein
MGRITIGNLESGEADLKQRVLDAMEEADKKTAHLNPESEEYIRLWMQVFYDALSGVTRAPG